MPISLSLKEQKQDVVNQAIRELQAGRDNASGSITLHVSATSTVVTAVNCSPLSQVFMFPTTADAAAELASGAMYVSAKNYGSFTITHRNNAQADRTFDWTTRG